MSGSGVTTLKLEISVTGRKELGGHDNILVLTTKFSQSHLARLEETKVKRWSMWSDR